LIPTFLLDSGDESFATLNSKVLQGLLATVVVVSARLGGKFNACSFDA
jgi:hypothetical protein